MPDATSAAEGSGSDAGGDEADSWLRGTQAHSSVGAASFLASLAGGDADAGIAVVSLSLLMTICGTGLLAMPACAAATGAAGFPLYAAGAAALFAVSIYLTARNMDICGPRRGSNIAEVGRTALGRCGFGAAALLCAADSWGGVMGAFRVIGDLIAPVGGPAWLQGPAGIYAACVLAYPMTLSGTMGGAWMSTLVALVAIIFLVILVVTQGFQAGSAAALRDQAPFTGGADHGLAGLRAVSVILYAFDCQVSVYPLYRELAVERPKAQSFARVGGYAVAASAAVYYAVGAAGLCAYGSGVAGDVLVAMPRGTVVRLCQSAVVLANFFMLPILAFEFTVLLRQYVFGASFGRGGAVAASNAATMLTAAAAAANMPNAYAAFSVVGAIAVPGLTFVMPPVCFLALTRTDAPYRPPAPPALAALPFVQSTPELEAMDASEAPSSTTAKDGERGASGTPPRNAAAPPPRKTVSYAALDDRDGNSPPPPAPSRPTRRGSGSVGQPPGSQHSLQGSSPHMYHSVQRSARPPGSQQHSPQPSRPSRLPPRAPPGSPAERGAACVLLAAGVLLTPLLVVALVL